MIANVTARLEITFSVFSVAFDPGAQHASAGYLVREVGE